MRSRRPALTHLPTRTGMLVVLLGLLLTLSACGNKGPLRQPDANPNVAATGL